MFGIDWPVLLVIALVIVIAATPQGREGLKSIVNTLGSLVGQGAKAAESTDRDRGQLEARVETETTAGLANAQAAETRAQEILAKDGEMRKELQVWITNRDRAKDAFLRLTTDNVPDEKQLQQIGQARSIGETAMQKIAGLEVALKANAENVEWAKTVVADTQRLYRALPQRAAELLMAGDVAAASQELAKAQTQLAASQQAFGSSEAGKLLTRMQTKATRAKAEAKAAQSRAVAAPVSANIASQQLDTLGTTSSFDEFVATSKPSS